MFMSVTYGIFVENFNFNFLLKMYETKLNTTIIFKNLAYIHMLDVVFKLDF